MAFDPHETDVMLAIDAQEPHPQVGIFLPGESLALPAEDPAFGHGVDDVFRVGVEHDLRAGEFEGFERHADGPQLHAVVGRPAESLGNLLAVGTREQDDAVAARSRVAQGRTVGIDGDLCQIERVKC